MSSEKYILHDVKEFDAAIASSDLSPQTLAPFLCAVADKIMRRDSHAALDKMLLRHWLFWTLDRMKPEVEVRTRLERAATSFDYAVRAGWFVEEGGQTLAGWQIVATLTPSGAEIARRILEPLKTLSESDGLPDAIRNGVKILERLDAFSESTAVSAETFSRAWEVEHKTPKYPSEIFKKTRCRGKAKWLDAHVRKSGCSWWLSR